MGLCCKFLTDICRERDQLTTTSFPAFSALFAILMAAAAAAPDDIPTYSNISSIDSTNCTGIIQ